MPAAAFFGIGAVLGLAALALLYRALLWDRARGRRRCRRCWYDMGGVSGLTCPECGRQARSERALRSTRRRYKRAALAILVLALAGGLGAWPRMAEGRWIKHAPTAVLIVCFPWAEDETDPRLVELMERLNGPASWLPPEELKLAGWEKSLLAQRCIVALDPAEPLRKRQQAMMLLLAVGPAASWQAEDVTALLDDADDWVVRGALKVLESVGPPAHIATPRLIELLEGGKEWMRADTMRALGAVGERARPALPALCKRLELDLWGGGDDAAEAARAIGRIGVDDPSAVLLVRALMAEAAGVREAAAESIRT